MTREQALEAIGSMIRYGRQHVAEVEFSAEDAARTDIDYLCQVCRVAVDAGATVLNLPDTVGYSVPEEYGAMFTRVREYLGDAQGVTLSAHCHDDLGMAVANSMAAIRAGVRQIECTINGIGERAGNASLEEVVVALAVRKDSFGVTTNIRLEELFPTSRMLTEITGAQVAPNKAIVGANAFAHEAGIHQDGIIKNPLTYEIMTPQSVGVPARSLVLGKHSGRNALKMSLRDLGYEPSRAELAECYPSRYRAGRQIQRGPAARPGRHRARSDAARQSAGQKEATRGLVRRSKVSCASAVGFALKDFRCIRRPTTRWRAAIF